MPYFAGFYGTSYGTPGRVSSVVTLARAGFPKAEIETHRNADDQAPASRSQSTKAGNTMSESRRSGGSHKASGASACETVYRRASYPIALQPP